jgi:hypothetical protein
MELHKTVNPQVEGHVNKHFLSSLCEVAEEGYTPQQLVTHFLNLIVEYATSEPFRNARVQVQSVSNGIVTSGTFVNSPTETLLTLKLSEENTTSHINPVVTPQQPDYPEPLQWPSQPLSDQAIGATYWLGAKENSY